MDGPVAKKALFDPRVHPNFRSATEFQDTTRNPCSHINLSIGRGDAFHLQFWRPYSQRKCYCIIRVGSNVCIDDNSCHSKSLSSRSVRLIQKFVDATDHDFVSVILNNVVVTPMIEHFGNRLSAAANDL
mgnify:CR=1 FL=1